MGVGLRDIDMTQAHFQEGTLNRVTALATGELTLATVEENGSVGDWSVVSGTGQHQAIYNPGGAVAGNYYRQAYTAANPVPNEWFLIRFDNGGSISPSETVFYSYLPNPGTGSQPMEIFTYNSAWGLINLIGFDEPGYAGSIVVYEGGTWVPVFSSYPAYTAIKIKFAWDWANDRWSLYVNDVLRRSNVPFESGSSGFRFWNERYDYSGAGIAAYVDNEGWPYKDGHRVHQEIDLSSVGIAGVSSVSWVAQADVWHSVTIETNLSLNGGVNWEGWQACYQGGPVPGISPGTNVSNGRLKVRETLATDKPDTRPSLSYIAVTVLPQEGHSAGLPINASRTFNMEAGVASSKACLINMARSFNMQGAVTSSKPGLVNVSREIRPVSISRSAVATMTASAEKLQQVLRSKALDFGSETGIQGLLVMPETARLILNSEHLRSLMETWRRIVREAENLERLAAPGGAWTRAQLPGGSFAKQGRPGSDWTRLSKPAGGWTRR